MIISIFAISGITFAIQMKGMSSATARASQLLTIKKIVEDFTRNSSVEQNELEEQINTKIKDSGFESFEAVVSEPVEVNDGIEKLTIKIIDSKLDREEFVNVYSNR